MKKKAASIFEKATFAGGCFWCMQPPFDELSGVISTAVGYTGGTTKNPSYEQVCSGKTHHVEAIEIIFDPDITSYLKLLEVFWRNIDPTTPNAQFVDIGKQYRSAIFYHDLKQKKLAEQSKEALKELTVFRDKTIVTEIISYTVFYKAEEYHQKYYQKIPSHYQRYRSGSGRDRYLKTVWEKISIAKEQK